MKISNLKSQISNSGFTLIELLVVISIIGILSTLLMANVGGVRERARDAQRKSDINQIQKALELYKNSIKPPEYPDDLPALTTEQIKSLPHDPKCGWDPDPDVEACTTTWPDYDYAKAWDTENPDALTYRIIACLENKSDQQKDNPSVDCGPDDKGVTFTRYEP